MINSDPERFNRKGNITRADFLIFNSLRVARAWMSSFSEVFSSAIETTYNVSLAKLDVGNLGEAEKIKKRLNCFSFRDLVNRLKIPFGQ